MNNSIYRQPLLYQAANADDETIKSNFLIRLHEYDIIIQDILNNPMKGSVQHYLLIGRRGSGKSTLLKRIQIEVTTNRQLKDKYIVINLAEEQANIYKLYDLVEEIIREVKNHSSINAEPEWDSDAHIYTRILLGHLQQVIKDSGRKVILLLDNIDRIFENIEDDASLLREYLLNYDDIRIIGSSTRMTEHFWKYNQPFYQFFRVFELQALTASEVKVLLLNWSDRFNIPQLKTFVETRPGQLETIRLLTDGLPRTLLFFVNILLTNTQDTGYEYLRHVMDNVTPLYQERLNTLPSSQRKIVLQMAFIWEAVGTGKLAEATRMNNNVISAQLKQLGDKGIVEKVETGTKNHLYRLTERFFNLWLIFTQGSPSDKRRAKYLTIFLENFYDIDQIQLLASEHLSALENRTLLPNKAVLITKALAQSNQISIYVRERLIQETLLLENIAEDIKIQLPPTLSDIRKTIYSFLEKKNFGEAMRMAKNFGDEEGACEYLQGIVLNEQERLDEAETILLSSIDKGFLSAMRVLSYVYKKKKDFVSAEKHLKTIRQYASTPLINFELGAIYVDQERYTLAKKYFSLATEADKSLIIDISYAYMNKLKFDEAEFFLRIGLDASIKGSATILASIFHTLNKNKQEALDLLKQDNHEDYNHRLLFKFISISVNVWYGNFSNIEENVLDIINNHFDSAGIILEQLLYHGQSNFVHKIFNSLPKSETLREHFSPLHYATITLTQTNNSISLTIPPEIKSTVDEILKRVKITQEYYGIIGS